MAETRLMAMQFIPSDSGGYWWPAGVPVTAEGEQTDWVEAWENGITAEEAQHVLSDSDTECRRCNAFLRKLRSLSTTGHSDNRKAEGDG